MSRRLPVFSPSKLNLYQRCPYAYWKTHIDRSMPKTPTTPAQARGQVTHTILKNALRRFAGGAELPVEVQAEARELMESHEHFEPEQIEAETAQVEQLATFALDHFNVEAQPVIVERRMSYTWSSKSGRPRYLLESQVDTILKHPGGTYEIIDWKTGGSTYPDQIQNVLLFLTGSTYLHQRLGVAREQIYLTNAYLGARKHVRVDTSSEALTPTWELIRDVVKRIESNDDWPATKNPLCEYCPLHQNDCPLDETNYLEEDVDEG